MRGDVYMPHMRHCRTGDERLTLLTLHLSYDFGMNMLGGLFGGMLEYVSLIVGIRAIYLIALAIVLAVVPLQKASTALSNS